MKSSDFVHLHLHTYYSILDGLCRIEEVIRKAKEYGMPAVAITDSGGMFGVIEFYEKAVEEGIKPIIGCEVYVAPGSRKDKKGGISKAAYHLTLLACNTEGYRNLMKLVSLAYLEGFYYRPRIDKELLSQYGKGLIGLSGCLKGEIPSLISEGNLKEARKVADEYLQILGKGNFYLEIMNLSLEGQDRINQELIKISKELKIPLVATNDVHYIHPQDASVHEVLLCLQTKTTLRDSRRLRFGSREFYFKSEEEMKKLFSEIPESITCTREIEEKCQVKLDLDKVYLPHFPVPPGYTLDSYLEELVWKGAQKRFFSLSTEIKERINMELEAIKRRGLSGYFLIVHDFINFAKERKIPVGPGRGSTAGSLVAYCLGITDINPLEYGLIFERFLNPGRKKLPDIDVDFCDSRREEVINYVKEKYGKDRVSQIITFGTMAARAVIRDVARVMGIPYAEADKIAKLIPSTPSITLEDALRRVPELKPFLEKYPDLFKIALSLEGTIRHASVHAAGVVIAPGPLTDFTPLFRTTDGDITTQYDMNSLSRIGILKMDFLGLRTLTVINETLRLIKERRGLEVDIHNLPLDDPLTYKLLQEGRTIGVFQLESRGMRDLLQKIKPEKFEDIIAVLALYRPGPLGGGEVQNYIRRKRGESKVEYLHPSLAPILGETYGIILYQEQVMTIAHEIAGFSMEEADDLRQAMGKKIPEKMKEMEERFIKGARERGIEEGIAKKIFDYMAYFAGYGFNKSHATAYAFISYRTAFLKANYPLEFMTSLLSSEKGNQDKVGLYIKECEEMGIEVLPPDVNKSVADFSIEGEKIRFGLAAVKNIGENAVREIVEARERREFTSWDDFCSRVPMRQVNRKVMESLVKCGAFDTFGERRDRLISRIPQAVDKSVRRRKEREQIRLFQETAPAEEETEEWSYGELLAHEKEVLGFYLTGHPLEKFSQVIPIYTTHRISQLKEIPPATSLRLAGVIASLKTRFTKNSKRMARFYLEDREERCEVIVFPSVWERWNSYLRNDNLVLVEGSLESNLPPYPVRAERVFLLEELSKFLEVETHILMNMGKVEEEKLEELRETLKNFSGEGKLYLNFYRGRESTSLLAGKNFGVTPSLALKEAVEKILGKGSIKFKLINK